MARRVSNLRPLACEARSGRFGAAEGIDRHLRRDRGHSVVVREPAGQETLATLYDLLGTLPRRSRWAGEADWPRRDRAVLLPSMRVTNAQELRNAPNFLGTAAAGPLRLPPKASWLLATAAAHFGDNALKLSPAG